MLYQFFYDAFVILTTAKELADWTLTLYNQDVRNPKGITPKKTFNLLTGQEYITLDTQQSQAQEIMEQKKQLEHALEVTLNDLKNFELKIAKKSVVKKLEIKPEAPSVTAKAKVPREKEIEPAKQVVEMANRVRLPLVL